MAKRLIPSIFFSLFLNLLYAVSDKPLDNFSSTSLYYTSGASATITPSIDNAVYAEGSSSLKGQYTLNGVSGNFVEIFRNYNTSTLDLSFNPDGLSLKVLGDVNNTDVFKFMLYEDQNMNGNPFDAGDEVYEFTSYSVLSSSSWTLLSMPYSAFTKFGGGNGTLDLNRIGAWRVYITNSGSFSSHTFYMDDLRQVTTYTAPLTGNPTLGGSFIQLWNTTGCGCGQWTQTQWENQMQQMKDACMDKLVIQYGVYSDNAWYSPSSLGYVTYTNPTLSRIFAAANTKGIEVYTGLYFDETWNAADKASSTTYSSLLAKQQQVTDELWTLFASQSSWKGWYIPQEINDLEWQTTASRNLLASYLQSVASYAKGKDNSKKVLIAPFFGPNRPADDLQSWWEAVLTTAIDIDILYVQDGIGTTRTDVDTDIPHYFAALKQACQNKGRIFGATIETFQQTDGWPINGNSFAAIPASINRLEAQLRETKLHTSEMIQFEWAYMQPALSSATQTLYNDYKNYTGCNPISTDISKFFDNNSSAFSIYPNPGKGIYFIRNNTINKAYNVEVYDSKGGLIFQGIEEKDLAEIRLPENTRGMFFIKIQYNDKLESKIIVKE